MMTTILKINEIYYILIEKWEWAQQCSRIVCVWRLSTTIPFHAAIHCLSLHFDSMELVCCCINFPDSSGERAREERAKNRHTTTQHKTKYWCGTPMVKVNVYIFSYKNYNIPNCTQDRRQRQSKSERVEFPLWTCRVDLAGDLSLHCDNFQSLFPIIQYNTNFSFAEPSSWSCVREREKCRSKFMAFKFTFLDQLSTNY